MNTIIDGIDYGLLFPLIGKWVGKKGLDIAPDANAHKDKSSYTDELIFTPSGPAENAEEQQLVSLKYHQVVTKNENGQIFHDQIGHWIYQPNTGLIMHSLTIPRGVCVLAGGDVKQHQGKTVFEVEAKAGAETFGIIQSPFMLAKAKTKHFHMRLTIENNQLHYIESMMLHIYGKDFEHIDQSQLTKVIYDLD